MELLVLLALLVSVASTLAGSVSKSTKQTIQFMSLQAAAIGFVELMYVLVNLVSGLHVEALVKFFAVFAEWFSAAAVSPLIIYWGMAKTENFEDRPMMSAPGVAMLLGLLVLAHLGLEFLYSRYLPTQLEAIFFISLMFTLSLFLMATRKDPFKIIVGLNMAENALYPLLARSPLNVMPFILVLVVFVNVVAVYIVIESYRDYQTLDLSRWRLTG
jgi:multisubunit Na+/H+ antiporter MnhC subunit